LAEIQGVLWSLQWLLLIRPNVYDDDDDDDDNYLYLLKYKKTGSEKGKGNLSGIMQLGL